MIIWLRFCSKKSSPFFLNSKPQPNRINNSLSVNDMRQRPRQEGTIMANNAKCFLIVLSIAMICSVNCPAKENDADFTIVEPNETPSIFSLIASAIQGNFEKINTWQGRISQETIATNRGERVAETLRKSTDVDPNNIPNEYQRISNYTTEFKIDVKNDRFFSFIDKAEPYIYQNPKTNVVYPSRLDHWVGPEKELVQIVTPEYQTEITPASWKKKDNAITSRIAIKELPHPVHRTDPREVFYFGDNKLWLSLGQILHNLQTPNINHYGVVIKKKSTGNSTTYRLELSSSKKELLGMYIFSGEVGFNQTYFETYYEDGSIRSQKTIEFVKNQDVFLPKKWETSLYFQDGGLMRQENCTIENQQINVSIPHDTFSDSTYLHDGDKLRDKIAGKEYKVKDANLVFVADLPASETEKKEPPKSEPNK